MAVNILCTLFMAAKHNVSYAVSIMLLKLSCYVNVVTSLTSSEKNKFHAQLI